MWLKMAVWVLFTYTFLQSTHMRGAITLCYFLVTWFENLAVILHLCWVKHDALFVIPVRCESGPPLF